MLFNKIYLKLYQFKYSSIIKYFTTSRSSVNVPAVLLHLYVENPWNHFLQISIINILYYFDSKKFEYNKYHLNRNNSIIYEYNNEVYLIICSILHIVLILMIFVIWILQKYVSIRIQVLYIIRYSITICDKWLVSELFDF